ncbi:hypothetical protein DID80_07185 [Candidatus Marinamargulisbacteria bacterium SCGC AAA071-K20]|nr:hypothetical protein DID80_07185 [Candidatus Marinamargulisbacteria bacterium SCGC AAA071-K20]
MSFLSDQDEKNKRYTRDYSRFGHQVKTVGWLSRDTQRKRFKQLLSFKPVWSGETVLDVGCGLGDFFHYIKANSLNINFTGVDHSSALIDAAKRAYPSGHFKVHNLFQKPLLNPVDVVFASGVFNLKMGDANEQLAFLSEGIKRLLALAKQGVAFNVLEENDLTRKIVKTDYYYYTQDDIKEICKHFNLNITISGGYLENDMTIFLRSG